jgi:hypothetical protein
MTLPFFLDVVADDIVADFADRSISAEVLVGTWELYKQKSGARVILGLGDGDGQDVGAGTIHYGSGGWFPTGDTTVARPLWINVQRVIVWVAAPPSPTAPPDRAARTARAATWSLTSSTLRAMWHSHGGTFPWGQLRWLNEDRAISNYGAAVQFTAFFSIPVLDDEDELVSTAAMGGSTTLDLGTTTIADPPAFTAP